MVFSQKVLSLCLSPHPPAGTFSPQAGEKGQDAGHTGLLPVSAEKVAAAPAQRVAPEMRG